METWYFKNLGDAMVALESLVEIEDLFQSTYVASVKHDAEPAVFTRHQTKAGLHCEVLVYFSPAAAALAAEINAQPCQSPLPDGLSLLAGSKKSWPSLFPEFMPQDQGQ